MKGDGLSCFRLDWKQKKAIINILYARRFCKWGGNVPWRMPPARVSGASLCPCLRNSPRTFLKEREISQSYFTFCFVRCKDCLKKTLNLAWEVFVFIRGLLWLTIEETVDWWLQLLLAFQSGFLPNGSSSNGVLHLDEIHFMLKTHQAEIWRWTVSHLHLVRTN